MPVNNEKIALDILSKNIKRRIRPTLVDRARFVFESAKLKLLKEVKLHPISQDLLNHNQNSSFVNGASLFGFMGFNDGDTPVEDLLEYLEQSINFIPTHKVIGKVDLRLPINLRLPSRGDFDKAGIFGMRWESGKSWPIGVEIGISGLPYYLHELGKGRSDEGVQAKHEINAGIDFRTTEYLTPIFQRFRTRVIGRAV